MRIRYFELLEVANAHPNRRDEFFSDAVAFQKGWRLVRQKFVISPSQLYRHYGILVTPGDADPNFQPRLVLQNPKIAIDSARKPSGPQLLKALFEI